jgi:hypothetical protein
MRPERLTVLMTRLLEAVALVTLFNTHEVSLQWATLIAALALAAYFLRERAVFSKGFLFVLMAAVVVGSVALWPRHRLHPLVIAAHAGPLMHALLWYSPRGFGQYYSRLSLGFLEVALASALTPELFVAAGIFLFFVISTLQLTGLHLWRDFENHARQELPRKIPRSVTAFGLGAALLVLAASLVIFPFLPRLQSPWSGPASRSSRFGASEVGYSEEVELSSGLRWLRGAATGSGPPVLRIFIEGTLDSSALPLGLLRMRVLSRFDGKTWMADSTQDQKLSGLGEGQGGRSLQAIREPLETDSLPMPYSGAAARIGSGAGASQLLPQAEGLFRGRQLAGKRISYEFQIDRNDAPVLRVGAPLERDLWVPREPGPLLADPSRWQRLAARIQGGRRIRPASAHEVFGRISAFFRNAGFEAALQDASPARSSADLAVLDRFVFEWRRGHCEWFAVSSLMLLRMQGIPARLVSGFRISTPPFGGVLTVRQTDAHLWVEAWSESAKAWIAYDPTPKNPVRTGILQRALDFLQESRNWASSHWYRFVLRPAETPESLMQGGWNPFAGGGFSWKGLSIPQRSWQALVRSLTDRVRQSRALRLAALFFAWAIAAAGVLMAGCLTLRFRALHWTRKSPQLIVRRMRHRLRQAFDARPEREAAFEEILLRMRFSGMKRGSQAFSEELARLDEWLAAD